MDIHEQQQYKSYFEQMYDEQHTKFVQPNQDNVLTHKDCGCSLCQKQQYLEQMQIRAQVKTEAIESTRTNIKDKDYIFIIKRLQPPALRSLRFSIPDVCCFNQDGEMDCIIAQNKIGKSYRYVKLKKQPFSKLKRMFLEKRPQKTQSSFDYYTKTHNSKMVVKKDKREIYEKNLEKAICETAICKYTDNNIQVLSEGEWIQLMGRRKTDIIFQSIQYLQSFTKSSQYFRINYISKQHDETELFKRAEIEIGIINKEIVIASSDYISEDKEIEYENSLSKDSLARLFTFKIVHFIDKIYGQKIIQGIFEWIIDIINQLIILIKIFILLGLVKLVSKQIYNYQISEDIDRISFKPEKKQDLINLQDKYQLNDSVIQIYTQIMNNEYQKKKQELGFDEKSLILNKDRETEQVFNKLHEGSRMRFQDTFKDTDSYIKNENSLLLFIKEEHGKHKKKVFPQNKIFSIPQPQKKQCLVRSISIGRPKTSLQNTHTRNKSFSNHQILKINNKMNTLPYLLAV